MAKARRSAKKATTFSAVSNWKKAPQSKWKIAQPVKR
jgi:hypothetical protein